MENLQAPIGLKSKASGDIVYLNLNSNTSSENLPNKVIINSRGSESWRWETKGNSKFPVKKNKIQVQMKWNSSF